MLADGRKKKVLKNVPLGSYQMLSVLLYETYSIVTDKPPVT